MLPKVKIFAIVLLLIALFAGALSGGSGAAQVLQPEAPNGVTNPTTVLYQGYVTTGGAAYTGTGYFKFAITNPAGNSTYWSNDGIAGGGMEPPAAVALAVTDGYFSVLLGDTGLSGMTQPLSSSVFTTPGRSLKVWFATTSGGTYTLVGLFPIGATPYALNAETLDGIDGVSLQMRVSGACGAGNAIRTVNTNGTVVCEPVASPSHTHWGAYWSGGGTGLEIDSSNNYGLYATSDNTAANYSGVMGQNTGVGPGVWGYNTGTGVGLIGYGLANSGVVGWTDLASGNYGLYTPDNAFAHSYIAGLGSALIAQNNGSVPLQVGDLVAVTGVGKPLLDDHTPVLQVRQAVEGSPGEVVGVVQSAFRLEMQDMPQPPIPEGEKSAVSGMGNPEGKVNEQMPVQVPVEGPAQPGDMLIIQVQGLAHVRVSAAGGAIQPGDLLTTGSTGLALRAEPMLAADGKTYIYEAGTIIGKALEAWSGGDGLIWVLIDLR